MTVPSQRVPFAAFIGHPAQSTALVAVLGTTGFLTVVCSMSALLVVSILCNKGLWLHCVETNDGRSTSLLRQVKTQLVR